MNKDFVFPHLPSMKAFEGGEATEKVEYTTYSSLESNYAKIPEQFQTSSYYYEREFRSRPSFFILSRQAYVDFKGFLMSDHSRFMNDLSPSSFNGVPILCDPEQDEYIRPMSRPEQQFTYPERKDRASRFLRAAMENRELRAVNEQMEANMLHLNREYADVCDKLHESTNKYSSLKESVVTMKRSIRHMEIVLAAFAIVAVAAVLTTILTR